MLRGESRLALFTESRVHDDVQPVILAGIFAVQRSEQRGESEVN